MVHALISLSRLGGPVRRHPPGFTVVLLISIIAPQSLILGRGGDASWESHRHSESWEMMSGEGAQLQLGEWEREAIDLHLP